ncbi:hypothetical protein [Nitrosopumilus sp.]|uniref:hypothetical protein n=1 Tax=Nitrosopumilus sp. TaxID=2024843 RepID=UPI003D1096E2
MQLSSIIGILTAIVGMITVGMTVNIVYEELNPTSIVDSYIAITELEKQNSRLIKELESTKILFEASNPDPDLAELNLTLLLIANKLDTIQESIDAHNMKHESMETMLSDSNGNAQVVIESQPFEQSLILVVVPTVITGIFAIVALKIRKTEAK